MRLSILENILVKVYRGDNCIVYEVNTILSQLRRIINARITKMVKMTIWIFLLDTL